MFLGLELRHAVEAFEIHEAWDVVHGDDDSGMVHHPWRDYWLERNAAKYRSQVEWTLPAFDTAVNRAHDARMEKNDGRVADGTQYPRVIANASNLHQAYVETGAVNHPDGPPATYLPPPCGLAVPDQTSNPRLMHNCFALLEAKDALRGAATLNWSVDEAIAEWDGVTVAGTPLRVTGLDLRDKGLTGSIPAELVDLTALESLWLSGNELSGCVPASLREVSENDVESLGLADCE